MDRILLTRECMSHFRLLCPTLLLFVAAACSDAAPADDPCSDSASTSCDALIFGNLKDEAAIEPLAKACPPSRTDALCTALRAGDAQSGAQARAEYDKAGAEVQAMIAHREDVSSAIDDAAVRYYVRERAHALMVRGAILSADPSVTE